MCGRRLNSRRRWRRGFTLIEAMMASGLLLAIVLAVCSAVTAGQQHAMEAHQRIAATLAAEELMGRLVAVPYDDLPTWNGYSDPVGTITGIDGLPVPDSLDMIGRNVRVLTKLQEITGTGVWVNGREVIVRAFNADARTLVEVTLFVPEPAP